MRYVLMRSSRRTCMSTDLNASYQAHEAQELIRQGTYDLPRMTKVLESDRVSQLSPALLAYLTSRGMQVFLLVDEGTVRRYKADLTDEIEPQINELLSRAEKGLQVLLKRESVLQAKAGNIRTGFISPPDTHICRLKQPSHGLPQGRPLPRQG